LKIAKFEKLAIKKSKSKIFVLNYQRPKRDVIDNFPKNDFEIESRASK